MLGLIWPAEARRTTVLKREVPREVSVEETAERRVEAMVCWLFKQVW